MMKMVILDENKKELDTFAPLSYSTNSKLEKSCTVPDIDEDTKKILNNLKYSVGVYSLNKSGDDFYVSFTNDSLLKYINLNIDEIRGACISDVFLAYHKESILLKKMKETYETNKASNFYFEYYNKNILQRRYKITFTKISDFVYIFAEDEADYIKLLSEQESIFKNNYNAIAIVQDDIIVKVNDKFLEFCNGEEYNVINKKWGHGKQIDDNIIKEIENNINKILDRKMFSYIFPIEIEKKGELIHYFNVNGSYIIYDDKPAVMLIFHDLTKDETNKRELKNKTKEALSFKDNLNIIQSVSNTGITYVDDGVYRRSNQLYKILEIEPVKEHLNKYILWDYIIEKDKVIFESNFNKLGVDNNATDFIVRIKTPKGNLKYIHCYIRLKSYNTNSNDKVIFYQDVTNEQNNLNKLHKALHESLKLKNSLEKIQRISKTSLCYVDDKTDDILLYSDSSDILGYNSDEYKDISDYLLKEDENIWKEAHAKCTPEHPEISFIQRIKSNNSIKYIRTYVTYEFDEYGNKIAHLSFFHDITEEIQKEKELKIALKDKEILLTEVHHRVKNNLQIILSLINLSRAYDTNPENILTNTETRIYAMALIHEKIYGFESLDNVDIYCYIESLVESLLDTYFSDIKYHLSIDHITLDMEKTIPLGLIINELVTNTIKHAFSSEVGNIYVTFKNINSVYTLIIEDDGVGLPSDFDLDNISTLGLMIVKNLILQLDGTISIIECEGTGFKIEFPDKIK